MSHTLNSTSMLCYEERKGVTKGEKEKRKKERGTEVEEKRKRERERREGRMEDGEKR